MIKTNKYTESAPYKELTIKTLTRPQNKQKS